MLRSAFLPAHRKLSPVAETQRDPTASDTRGVMLSICADEFGGFRLGRCWILGLDGHLHTSPAAGPFRTPGGRFKPIWPFDRAVLY